MGLEKEIDPVDDKLCNKWNYYVFHGLVTLFFANNFLVQFRITMKFLHNFFRP